MSAAAVTLKDSCELSRYPFFFALEAAHVCRRYRLPLHDRRTGGGEISRKDMRVIWLLLVAAFVAILNETTMGIAIPHLNTDLGIPPELGQWLTSAFMLTMAVVIPTTGFILQRFTTRQVFIAAMIAFSLGTLVALIAPGFTVLLVGRVIQAAGTGIMMPLLMTTIMNVVPPQSRGRMMGRVGLVISLAPRSARRSRAPSSNSPAGVPSSGSSSRSP